MAHDRRPRKLAASLATDDVAGNDALQSMSVDLAKMNPAKITIFDAISHGRIGAAHGELNLPAGPREFSVFVRFQNTKAERVSNAKVFFAELEALASR